MMSLNDLPIETLEVELERIKKQIVIKSAIKEYLSNQIKETEKTISVLGFSLGSIQNTINNRRRFDHETY